MDGTGATLGLYSIPFLVAYFVVGIIVGAFFLWLALMILGIPEEKRAFMDVIVTQLINIVVGLIPILGCILQWYFIKERHTDSWGTAIVAWILAIIIPVAIVYGALFGLGLLTYGY